MKYTTIFFDLDDTLYPSRNGLWEAIRERMGQYMLEVLGMPEDLAKTLRRSYYQTYGTTLRGLQLHHGVNADEYLEFVHDLPLETYIQPDPGVVEMIARLPQQRFIFTNADANHAGRVLRILKLQDCFEAIIDIRALEFACKPEMAAYRRALSIAGNPDPRACLMLDDSAANLQPASDLGLTTVLVGEESGMEHQTHYTIGNIKELPSAVPELLDGSRDRTNQSGSR